ncbi:hypothetical protein [Parafrankia discariae]|uniref:hypothetical protein n=1 Tax=Parafrankia discariae TaxID=365528 RepID=UPI0003A8A239|nr:hypothetical protein [Parafrankia discariae]
MRRVGRGPDRRRRRIIPRITPSTTFRAMVLAVVSLLGTTGACGTVPNALPTAGGPLPAAAYRD